MSVPVAKQSGEGNFVEEEVHNPNEVAFTTEETVESRYVHPDAKALFARMPCVRTLPIAGPAFEAFGPVCVSSLGAVYLLSKGIAKNLISYSIYPMFIKRYGVTPEVQQRMSGISSMGFAIKPLTAIFADSFSFLGYTKRWYMAISCLLGLVCAVVYGILPAKKSSASPAAAMIFLATFCIANIDVLSEGHYSRLIKKFPVPGAQLISYIWAFIMVGTIVAAAIQGPLSDKGIPQVGAFISAALVGSCFFFFVFNLYGEKKSRIDRLEDFKAEQLLKKQERELKELEEKKLKPSEPFAEGKLVAEDGVCDVSEPTDSPVLAAEQQSYLNDEISNIDSQVATVVQYEDDLTDEDYMDYPNLTRTCCCGMWEVNSDMVSRNIAVTFYGLLMTVGVISLAILTIVGSTYQLLYGCVVISVVLCVTGFLCIPVTVMKANLFGWIQLCSYILIPGALDNFYMADEACLPNGPHFSQTFYNTVGAVIGNVAGLFGVYLFSAVFSKRSYRVTCICTTVVQVVASLFDLIIVKRWNRPHMPDHAMYILGDAIVYQACYMLNYMPLNVLISRLCPKGCESTMFAILASFSNLGASTSSSIGAILMETVWPVTVTSTYCDFSNVPWLIITGHLITPLICIPLVFPLLPGDRVCDELDPKHVDGVPIAQNWINKLRGHKSPEPKEPETATTGTDEAVQVEVARV